MDYRNQDDEDDSNRSLSRTYGKSLEQHCPGHTFHTSATDMVVPDSNHQIDRQPAVFALYDETNDLMANGSWPMPGFQDPSLDSLPTAGLYSSFNPSIPSQPAFDKQWYHFEPQQLPVVERPLDPEQGSGSYFADTTPPAMGFLPLEAHTQHPLRDGSRMTELDQYLSELDPNTFFMSGFVNSGHSEAGSANSAQIGRPYNAYLPDDQISQSWMGPFNPSLVVDGTQVESANLGPQGMFPPAVALDNELSSDEASEDDACGGSLFECTGRNSRSRSSMEKEDIALLNLLIRLWGLKDPWAIMEPAFMSGAPRLTDYQYDGWLSRFVIWCRYEIGVIHGHTQCPSLQKALKAHHTASGNACRSPSPKSGPSLKSARVWFVPRQDKHMQQMMIMGYIQLRHARHARQVRDGGSQSYDLEFRDEFARIQFSALCLEVSGDLRANRVQPSEALRQVRNRSGRSFADVMALTVDSRDPLRTVKTSHMAQALHTLAGSSQAISACPALCSVLDGHEQPHLRRHRPWSDRQLHSPTTSTSSQNQQSQSLHPSTHLAPIAATKNLATKGSGWDMYQAIIIVDSDDEVDEPGPSRKRSITSANVGTAGGPWTGESDGVVEIDQEDFERSKRRRFGYEGDDDEVDKAVVGTKFELASNGTASQKMDEDEQDIRSDLATVSTSDVATSTLSQATRLEPVPCQIKPPSTSHIKSPSTSQTTTQIQTRPQSQPRLRLEPQLQFKNVPRLRLVVKGHAGGSSLSSSSVLNTKQDANGTGPQGDHSTQHDRSSVSDASAAPLVGKGKNRERESAKPVNEGGATVYDPSWDAKTRKAFVDKLLGGSAESQIVSIIERSAAQIRGEAERKRVAVDTAATHEQAVPVNGGGTEGRSAETIPVKPVPKEVSPVLETATLTIPSLEGRNGDYPLPTQGPMVPTQDIAVPPKGSAAMIVDSPTQASSSRSTPLSSVAMEMEVDEGDVTGRDEVNGMKDLLIKKNSEERDEQESTRVLRRRDGEAASADSPTTHVSEPVDGNTEIIRGPRPNAQGVYPKIERRALRFPDPTHLPQFIDISRHRHNAFQCIPATRMISLALMNSLAKLHRQSDSNVTFQMALGYAANGRMGDDTTPAYNPCPNSMLAPSSSVLLDLEGSESKYYPHPAGRDGWVRVPVEMKVQDKTIIKPCTPDGKPLRFILS
ncbi:hypothetical protein FFLO_06037 [Filobasidium floriforme]|uniref:Uncharacterized protein n=1 Tax=Filobasidium floriforme TaxID=5210 RepID=A0A8K0NND8_9TREE|nr:uncharacterized protein HD553DRAFT_322784 [Filobasidium floriforme]KAG7528614.1 hypothetical protein FFLO_06037 [Filobasidium floriforme]KAH8087277.1 hypothetical protein HD553DRAFT_322784 [Filobasidium floriforme]